MKHVLIVGFGEIGLAMQRILQQKPDVEIVSWDKDTRKMPKEIDLHEEAGRADIILICVPSVAVREVTRNISTYLRPEAIVISLAKGIEDSGTFVDEVLKEELAEKKVGYGLLAGPMLAEELMTKKRGVGVVVGSSAQVHTATTDLFSETDLLLEHSEDLRGVAVAGVLKNIYAILLGVSDGLRWGTNRKGWLLSAVTHEMAHIIGALGGNKETAYGTAGLGDLSATGFSPFSTNRDMGQHLALGNLDFSSEGKHSVDPIVRLLNGNKYPLLDALQDILTQVASPRERLESACVQIHAGRGRSTESK